MLIHHIDRIPLAFTNNGAVCIVRKVIGWHTNVTDLSTDHGQLLIKTDDFILRQRFRPLKMSNCA